VLAGAIGGRSYSSRKGLDVVSFGELLRIRAVSKFLEEIDGILVARVTTTRFIEHTTPDVEVARGAEVGLEQQFREEVLKLGIVRLGKTDSRGIVERRLKMAWMSRSLKTRSRGPSWVGDPDSSNAGSQE
jgi:hypothetical protein